MSERPKTDLRRVPTNALWKELERRESREYSRRVSREYKLIAEQRRATQDPEGRK